MFLATCLFNEGFGLMSFWESIWLKNWQSESPKKGNTSFLHGLQYQGSFGLFWVNSRWELFRPAGHSQNTKFLSDCNRHVSHNLCIYNQYKIDKYIEKFFVGSLNSPFLLNLLHLKCSELLHCEQTTCFELLYTSLSHFIHLSLLWWAIALRFYLYVCI